MRKIKVNNEQFFFITLKTLNTCCEYTKNILLAHQAAAVLTGNTLTNEFLSFQLTDTATSEDLLNWYLQD